MIETRAPGKLFIAGEYAVVQPGEPAVLIAVDRFIQARLIERAMALPTPNSKHVQATIDTFELLRAELGLAGREYEIEITTELESEQGVKLGLGSSAAVTVAVVDALNQFYNANLSMVDRFKIALLATLSVSPEASGGDLAACTFGGWIRYVSPDRASIVDVFRSHGVSEALSKHHWQGLQIESLPAPVDYELLVGWTGTPASTSVLVNQVRSSASLDDNSQHEHHIFLAESRGIVEAICESLRSRDDDFVPEITKARSLLQALGRRRAIDIETDRLRMLCDIAEQHGCAAKPSGAGGGDCGIVLARVRDENQEIIAEWMNHGILPLSLAPYDTIAIAGAERRQDEH